MRFFDGIIVVALSTVFISTVPCCVKADTVETQSYEKFFSQDQIQKDREFFSQNNDGRNISEKLEIFHKRIDEICAKLDKEPYFQNNISNKLLNKSPDEQVNAYIRFMNDNGIGFVITPLADGPYHCFYPKYMVKNFSVVLPKEIIDYYSVLDQDIAEGYKEDGALQISWDELRIKIIRYDDLLTKMRLNGFDCAYITNDIKKRVKEYLGTYIFGSEGRHLYEQPNMEEASKSYEKFLIENKNSKFYPAISKFYDLLKRNNFKTKQVFDNPKDKYMWNPYVVDEENKPVKLQDMENKYYLESIQFLN